MEMVENRRASRRTVLKSTAGGLAGLTVGLSITGSASAYSEQIIQVIETERLKDNVPYQDWYQAPRDIVAEVRARTDKEVESALQTIPESAITSSGSNAWEYKLKDALIDTFGTKGIRQEQTSEWIILDYVPIEFDEVDDPDDPIDLSEVRQITAKAPGRAIEFQGLVAANYAFVERDLLGAHASRILDEGIYDALLEKLPDSGAGTADPGDPSPGGDAYNPYKLPFYVYVSLYNYLVTDIDEIGRDLGRAATAMGWDNSGPWKS